MDARGWSLFLPGGLLVLAHKVETVLVMTFPLDLESINY
jgi:hypothetical protein